MVCLSVIFLLPTVQAQDTDILVEMARGMVEEAVEAENYPGLSIAVSVKGETVWAEGFGFADIENDIPVTTTSEFRIGSISKPFTAAAVAQLVAAERLDVDAPIQQYVPSFPEKEWTITTRQVGGHIGGIRHYLGDENMSDKPYATVVDGLAIFQESPLLFEPGTQYSYSSYGWNLVSAVVESASGVPFLDYMDEHVFGALGMDHTGADFAMNPNEDRVSFYVRDEDGNPMPAPYVDNSYKWAGGGFLSTPLDMLTFANAHLGDDFLTPDAKLLLFTTQHLTDGSATGYGFGWSVQAAENGHVLLGHTGGSVGGTTLLTMSPSEDIVVAMAINLTGANLEVGRRIMTLFLEAETP